MSERPILFSGAMVRAILDGRKTQTRRVIKPPKTFVSPRLTASWLDQGGVLNVEWECDHTHKHRVVKCPYGAKGDALWVREKWRPGWAVGPGGHFNGPGLDYAADNTSRGAPKAREVYGAACDTHNGGRWKPSIHMPKWASRLQLEVVDVRVERIQDITEEDAAAEGIKERWTCLNPGTGSYALDNDVCEDFRVLWDSINESRGYGWEKNPWCWVVEFRRSD